MNVMRTTANAFFGILLLLLASPLFATTLVVGVDNQAYYPHFQVKAGQLTGYIGELLQAFANSKQYQLDIKTYPARKLLEKMVNNEIGFRYPDNPEWRHTFRRKWKNIYYSERVAQFTDGTLVRGPNNSTDARPINTIGIIRGIEPTAYLHWLNQGKVRAKEIPDFDSMVKHILQGEIDGGYYNIEVGLHALKIMGVENDLQYDRNLPSVTNYYHLSTIRHKSIVDEFNQFLKNNSGIVKRLKDKYHLL